ncbi:MAG: lysine--tRNA ligase, partial [Methanomicrobiales archaeon]|nr:lysine--tRNA ligase [Methanomicrobiales archaeon]
MSDIDHTCFDTAKIDKIQELRERGVTVYPYTFDRRDTVLEIKERFSAIEHDKSEEEVSTAGRVYVVRQHGKTIFADLGDSTG